jgi:hypothetical protein
MSIGEDSDSAARGGVAIDLRRAIGMRGVWPIDDSAVTVEVTTPDGDSRLIVPVGDVQRLVGLLLLLARTLDSGAPEAETRHVADLSVMPATSLSVGELPDGDTLLAVAVGPTMLGFSLSPAAATKLGRSLLLTAATDAART